MDILYHDELIIVVNNKVGEDRVSWIFESLPQDITPIILVYSNGKVFFIRTYKKDGSVEYIIPSGESNMGQLGPQRSRIHYPYVMETMLTPGVMKYRLFNHKEVGVSINSIDLLLTTETSKIYWIDITTGSYDLNRFRSATHSMVEGLDSTTTNKYIEEGLIRDPNTIMAIEVAIDKGLY